MFHRYSEPFRRVIFFARQEASRLGGATVSTEHLLLGLLWENSWLVEPLLASGHTVEALKRKIETVASSREKLPTSVEMRLAEPAKAALSYAEEEATRLLSSTVDVSHLLLGLLRTHDSKAANLLAEFGLKVDDLRMKVVQGRSKATFLLAPSPWSWSGWRSARMRSASPGRPARPGTRLLLSRRSIDPSNSTPARRESEEAFTVRPGLRMLMLLLTRDRSNADLRTAG